MGFESVLALPPVRHGVTDADHFWPACHMNAAYPQHVGNGEALISVISQQHNGAAQRRARRTVALCECATSDSLTGSPLSNSIVAGYAHRWLQEKHDIPWT